MTAVNCLRKLRGPTVELYYPPGDLSHVMAVWNRAGWQLGAVLPCYISAEEGGDQTVCIIKHHHYHLSHLYRII